ncbi:MAG TPA: hypothetical protein VJ732_01170 [Bryobacteraceae bacterium]|nr:hypothetical protein [Bryobacteraceae bacterium]
MRKHNFLLWLAVLTGPIVWLVSFGANFALAPWACALRWKPALYTVSAVALLITAGSGILAWNEWRQLGREFPGEAGGWLSSSRALATGGILLSAMFFLVIAAQTIVEGLLGACE